MMFDDNGMRTTLDIADDVLLAAKELARHREVTVGRVLSELARQSLTPASRRSERGGVPLFPVKPGAGIVTLALVNRLRDETP